MSQNKYTVSGDIIDYDKSLNLVKWFSESANLNANKIAAVDKCSKITYAQLNKASDSMAYYLIKQSGCELKRVGVAGENSINRLILILGILKTGAAYVPLDPNYPKTRLAYIAKVAEVDLIVSAEECLELFDELHNIKVVMSESLIKVVNEHPRSKPNIVISALDPVHILFTSGSTGRPKGVVGSHQAIVNRFIWTIQEFPLSNSEILCHKSSLNFIPSVWEIFGPLVCGCTVILIRNEDVKDVYKFIDILSENKVNRIILVPSLLDEIIDVANTNKVSLGDLALWMTSGERLSCKTISRFNETFPNAELINIYGSTEIEDGCYFRTRNCDLKTAYAPIGKPIANSKIIILKDKAVVARVGEEGEICFCGPGVAKKYKGAVSGMREKRHGLMFCDHEEFYFKTGDYGRVLSSGDIEYLGRKDHQVKIRGQRAELGEIEALVQNVPAVDKVAVKYSDNANLLVCYYVSSSKSAHLIGQIKKYLLSMLPEYMVPVRYIQLSVLPLTPNGKIDRLNLPEIEVYERPLRSKLVEPTTKTEEELVEKYEWVLKLKHVGITDEFYELGGDSLRAVQLITNLNESYGINLSLKEFVENQTPYKLSKIVMAVGTTNIDTREYECDTNEIQLSPLQKRLWIQQEILGKDDPVFNLCSIFELPKTSDEILIRESLNLLLKRHSILSTRLNHSVESPVLELTEQAIINSGTINFANDVESKRFVQEYASIPLRVDDRLTEISICKVKKKKGLFILLKVHHLIFDGWSLGVFVKELMQIIKAKMNDREPQLDIAFSSYNNITDIEKQHLGDTKLIEYWQEYLSDYSGVLGFPLDSPRRKKESQRNGSCLSVSLSADIESGVDLLAKELRITPYNVYLAAYYILLSRYTKQDDIVIGVPTAQRNHSILNDAIGFFVNTIPVRIKALQAENIANLLRMLSDNAATLDGYKSLPFDVILNNVNVPRDHGCHPIYQVMFTYQSFDVQGAIIPGCPMCWSEVSNNSTEVDISLVVQPKSGSSREIVIEYNQDILRASTINRLLSHYTAVLTSMISNQNQLLCDVDFIPMEEKQAMLKTLNQAKGRCRNGQTLYEMFVNGITKYFNKIAVECGDAQLTYKALEKKVQQLSEKLVSYGVGRNDYVGVSIGRSENLIISMFAIWKLGAIYLPISPDLPQQRVSYILDDTLAKYALVDNESQFLYQPYVNTMTIVCLDSSDRDVIRPAKGQQFMVCKPGPNDVAYVMYTSGSTGKPKGVLISQRSIVNRMLCLLDFYNVNASCRHLQYSSYSFDTSLEELLLPILSGGVLVVAHADFSYDPQEFVSLIDSANVTTINFVPSLLRVFLDYVENNASHSCKTLKYVIAGAERLTNDIVEKFYMLYPDKVLFNSYGPTENTIDSTLHVCTKNDLNLRSIPIGKAIDGSTCYVLDEKLRLVPFGVTGELFVGGVGLALGYLNRPELTNEKFIGNPYVKGEKIYRTGDLVRMHENGLIEFLGRNDNQVKVRGYRIELGEVETAIRCNSAISDVVVIAKADDSGEAYLIAYIKCNKYDNHQLDENELKKELMLVVPSYMIPRIFIFVKDFPLLSSGKVDMRSLPEPKNTQQIRKNKCRQPVSLMEKQIWNIWSKILNISEFGIDEDFFFLGGSSIQGIQMINAVRNVLDASIALRDFFQKPTVETIIKLIESSTVEASLNSYNQVHKDKKMPLSCSQERLWFLDKYNRDNSENIIPILFRIQGKFELDRFESACREICSRHEALRLNISHDRGIPFQFVRENTLVDFDVIITNDADKTISRELQRSFNLESETLIRFRVFQHVDEQYTILITMHHIIADGWSCAILLQELSLLYQSGNQFPVNADDSKFLDYLDYVSIERCNAKTKYTLSSYWDKALEGPLPLLQLPLDKSRPVKQTFPGDCVEVGLSQPDFELCISVARLHNTSIFSMLLAAYFYFLHIYSGQNDLIVGTVFANRLDQRYEKIIGFFANTLPIRLQFSNDCTFAGLVSQVRENLLELSSRQDTPFEKIVEKYVKERDASRNPLFQTLFVMQDTLDEAFHLSNIKIEQAKAPHFRSKFDLSVLASVKEFGASFIFEFNTDLFHKETIEGMAQSFITILSRCINMMHTPINQLDVASNSEKNFLKLFNDTDYHYDYGNKMLDELAYDQFRHHKDKVAIVAHDRKLTYHEVNILSNKLAHWLISQGVTRNNQVAIVMEKGWEQVVAVYAILKAGGAYLPIYAHDHENRIAELLTLGCCEVVLTQSKFIDKLMHVNRYKIQNVDDVCSYDNYEGIRPSIERRKNDLAYVIYTSGSTGKPKGVMIEHSAVVNTIIDINQRFQISSRDVIYGIASLNFDLSVYDIFGTFLAGATLVLPSESNIKNPVKWLDDIDKYSVTLWNSVPALMQMMCDHVELNDYNFSNSTLNNVLLSGDWISLDLPEKIKKYFGKNTMVTSLGGATEASIWSIAYPIGDVQRHWKSIPYGRPLHNQKIYVLSESCQALPVGAIGEIHVGGLGVSKGYWRDAVLTKEAFITYPVNGELLYKTGDLGRLTSSGNVEFLGRRDHQIKIRGYRVELEEIQFRLMENQNIDKALVIDYRNDDGTIYLTAYIMSANSNKIDDASLRSELKQKLPDYMVPSYFVQIKSIPLTANGKVDRKSLPAPNVNTLDCNYISPLTDVEKRIKAIWCELLKISKVSRDANFFEIGGHSLLATRLVFALNRAFSVDILINLIFESPVLSDLASNIEMLQRHIKTNDLVNDEYMEVGEL